MNLDEPLPPPVLQVVHMLEGLVGAQAVVLGGSRASGTVDASSDWDIAIYYRGELDIGPLAAVGTVHAPGSWGRIMNGGAWLQVEGLKLDVMLRDFDVVQHWAGQADKGRFEVDALLGDLAGRPTYSLLAEWAVGRLLRGSMPEAPTYPAALASNAPRRWRTSRDFNLAVASMHAARANAAGTVGLAARALMEEAHARMSEQRRWTLNEKRLVADAGLSGVLPRFNRVPESATELSQWVTSLAGALDAERESPAG